MEGGGGAGNAQAVTTISNEWHNKWQRQQHNFLMQSADNSSRMQIHRFMGPWASSVRTRLPALPSSQLLPLLRPIGSPAESTLHSEFKHKQQQWPQLDTFGSTSNRVQPCLFSLFPTSRGLSPCPFLIDPVK